MKENYMTSESLERLSKLIVDEVYSNIQNKTGHLLALYKSYDVKHQGTNKYFSTMHKRYKYLTNYITFVRKNKGYWDKVYNVLLRELSNETDSLLMDIEPDSFGG